MRGHVHLVLGPIGAGKSTYAIALAQAEGGVRLNLDEWMQHLFRPDRPSVHTAGWYAEREARCVKQICRVVLEVIRPGHDVVLELGLLTRLQRESFYGWVDANALELTVHLLDAPREVRRARVEQRNRARTGTFVMEVPPHIFELADGLWEPLTEDERAGRAFVDVG